MAQQSKPPRRNSRKDHASELDQAQHLSARAELSEAVQKAIKDRGWTQVEAARILGVAQPRISDLMNGRTEKFTVDMLMIWLEKLGRDVTVTINPRLFALESKEPCVFTLYVANEPHAHICASIAAIYNGDASRFSVKVVNVVDNPDLAAAANVASTPCLVKESPPPRVVLVGNLSAAHVLWCLP